MWLLSFFLLFIVISGMYIGLRSWVRIDQLNTTNFLNTILFTFGFFTVLLVLYNFGYFPQSVAAPFMMIVYSLIAGFFAGYAIRLFRLRKKAGNILYQNRTFWVDHAPNILGVALIMYGIFRTSILSDLPVTGIRLTSGISLMSFGLFTWTLKPVPEFRSKGIFFLDRFITWEHVISWVWQSEEIIGIEYISEEKPIHERIKEFVTSVPINEKKELEIVLKSKMDEFGDARKKKLLNKED